MEPLAILTRQLYKECATTEQAKFLLESDPQAALNLLSRLWPPRVCNLATDQNASLVIQWHDLKWSTRPENPEFDMKWPNAIGQIERADSKEIEAISLKYNENFVFRAMDSQFRRLRDLAKDNETGEWARLGELDTAQGTITFLNPSNLTFMRTLSISLLSEGFSLPPLYRGQLVRIIDNAQDRWWIVSGLSYTPSRPRDFPFDGVIRLAVLCWDFQNSKLPSRKVSDLIKQAGVNGCIMLVTGASKFSDIEDVLTSHPDCLAVTDGGLATSQHRPFLRVCIGGKQVPCVFSALDLCGITTNRKADADKVLAEVIAQRHLLPAGWQTDFPPSLPPERLSDGELVPGEDVIMVTPGPPCDDVKQLIGQYLGHSLVRLPSMHMALIAIKGACGEGRVPILQHRVSVAITKLIL